MTKKQTQPAWLNDRDLAAHYSVSRATIWRWVNQGHLPRPHRVGVNCTRWLAREIEAHDEKITGGDENAGS